MSTSISHGPTKTCAGLTATFTSAGYVPHIAIRLQEGRLLAPVKLATQRGPRGGNNIVYGPRRDIAAPEPLCRDGKYVYALPGGGEMTA